MDFEKEVEAIISISSIRSRQNSPVDTILTALHSAYKQGRAEGYRAGADEMREACAKIAEVCYGSMFHDKTARRTGKKIAMNIRAINIPSPKEPKA